jgi:hypothetical protein
MKRIFLASLLAAILVCYAKFSDAQTIQYVYSAVTHNSTTVSTSCGDFLSSCNIIGTGAQFHQLSWNVTGTLSACSVRVDSSADGITWNTGDIIAAQTCTSNGNITSTALTVNFVRVNITSITPVSTASLTTNLTGYANNPAGGGGGVTSFSAGTLSPLFTTSVATPTTTPALSFTLSNAAAGTVLGNNTGGSAAPAYQTNITLTQGSIVANTPAISSTQTWNASGVAFTNLLFNTTCTAAATASKILDMQIGGVSALNLVFGAANCGTSTTLNIGKVGAGGIAALVGGTSGSATMSAPAVAGTVTNPVTNSNVLAGPNGSCTAPTYGYTTNGNFGTAFSSNNSNQLLICSGGASSVPYAFSAGNGFTAASNWPIMWASGTDVSLAVTIDTAISRSAAGVVAVGVSNVAGNEAGLLRDANACRVTADITLPVNTATTVCTWSLPAVAKAWAWQCKIPWAITAGSGTNTLAIIANASQTPTGTTNGSAEIKTTNTNTATEAVTAISASGTTTLLTSGTITPAATVFQSSTSGTLLASATAGTFAIQMTAAGTTATAAAKAGATCYIY